MIKKEKIYEVINQLDNYKGLIRTGDEAFEIVELKLKKILKED